MAGPTVVQTEIIAEPDAVWRTVSDVDRWPRILTSMSALLRLEGAGMEVGAKWRETRPILGLTATYEVTVVDVQPGSSVTLALAFDDADARLTYRFKPSSLGTRLQAEVAISLKGAGLNKINSRLKSAIVGGGGADIAKEVATRDLADFKAALRPLPGVEY